MNRKKPVRSTRRRLSSHRHGPDDTRCLDIIKQISAYIDDELPIDICRELRRHLGACPNCEKFVASLQQTVSLCRHCDTPPCTEICPEAAIVKRQDGIVVLDDGKCSGCAMRGTRRGAWTSCGSSTRIT